MVVNDPTLEPCLADLTASLTGTASLAPGDDLEIDLQGGPGLPVLILAAVDRFALGLGALGYTQVDLFHAVRLADSGLLGVPLPNSNIDALGHWHLSQPTPQEVALVGWGFWVEAFILDPQALNGSFHQPRALRIDFH